MEVPEQGLFFFLVLFSSGCLVLKSTNCAFQREQLAEKQKEEFLGMLKSVTPFFDAEEGDDPFATIRLQSMKQAGEQVKLVIECKFFSFCHPSIKNCAYHSLCLKMMGTMSGNISGLYQ